ncbi:hypothetical protein LTR78_006463 [Recurvomyces mirabilis]|uniref:Uncharacterized protein n=1 Tax=Recurvomyces mirabilis TaxID=574656 RepID=A0AAE0WKT9_9PEZI|nr:hypothetical protein LTR78_006463 [Recurvomyces mirabilis]KAK5151117.1 hypothetical protein LTS14_009613 [Recurvomyces mirabilis]
MPEDTLHIIDMNGLQVNEAIVCESLHALDHFATVGHALKDNWIKMNIRLPLSPEKLDGHS